MKKSICLFLVLMFLCASCVGCQEAEEEAIKVRDLDFTVVSEENIPKELVSVLEEEKQQVFYKTYSDGNFMYLCVGYGEQETGGYSIAVNELYLTEENICMDTTLFGPTPEENATMSKSYPYVVVCTEYLDKPVVFQ